jgi:hypothetical protein
MSSVAALALVVAPFAPSPAPPAAQPTAQTVACVQSAFVLNSARQEDPLTWVLNVSSIPSYLPADATVRAIVAATDTVMRARTPCPGRDLTGVETPGAIFGGTTSRSADVTPDGQCVPDRNSDGINVVSFGSLPRHSVAVACTYTHAGDIWQADIMLNDQAGTFTTSPEGPACTTALDVQAVMTHERGHSFGLGHVPEALATADLAMSTFVGRCDASARTLGRGDVLGLRSLYTLWP